MKFVILICLWNRGVEWKNERIWMDTAEGGQYAGAGCDGMGQFLSVDEDWFGWYPAVLYYCIKIWYRVYCGFTFVF